MASPDTRERFDALIPAARTGRSGRSRVVSTIATPVAIAILATCLCAAAASAEGRWFKGNTHTHTNRAAPETVARWYKDHDYQFIVLTDLHEVTPVEGVNAALSETGRFLVLPGVEISFSEAHRVVDVIGIGVGSAVLPDSSSVVAEMLTDAARVIREGGGVAQVAHPNLSWAVTAEDLLAAEGFLLFELWNAEPGMHNLGGGDRPSTEEMWDQVLSTGRPLFGVAADDAHDFAGEFGPERANPGRAWVMVRAPELSAGAIGAALAKGDFYSSTGVELLDYVADAEGIRIRLPEQIDYLGWLEPSANPTRYRTRFIGRDGVVLKLDTSASPTYRFRGDELYVRARIEGSAGGVAWTQPVFPRPERARDEEPAEGGSTE